MPGHIASLKNASILLDIDYDIEPEYEEIEFKRIEVELTDTPMSVSFSVYRKLRFQIYFKRRFNQGEFDSWKNKRMTGMRVKWKYNGDFKEKQIFEDYNKNFIKLTNLLLAVDSETLWKNIIAAKVDWFIKREYSSSYSRGKAIGLGKQYSFILSLALRSEFSTASLLHKTNIQVNWRIPLMLI